MKVSRKLIAWKFLDLLEEEVIVDELLLHVWLHAIERVELTGELSVELAASLDNLGHDFVSLLVGDARSEGKVSQVTADTNTGGLDHSGLLGGERRAVELGGVHVGDMGVSGAVTVVVLHDLVEEVLEGSVGVLRTGVAANARVDILAAREDASLEGDTVLVALVVVLVPDVLGQVLADERLGAIRELRPGFEVLW